MLGNVLKKVALVLLVVVVYQNWGKIERVFNPSQMVAEQTRAQASVVLYATDWCGYCKQARQYFQQNGISFVEYDIEKDQRARNAYDSIGGNGVPVILVGDKRMNGFSVAGFQGIYQ